MLAARSVASPPSPIQQPHIEVAVQPQNQGPSKWEEGKPSPTKGHLMVDTGAAVTIVTQKWAAAHGLRVTAGRKVQIRGAGGANVETLGTTAFTLQLSPTLEIDLADVVVSEGNFY